MSSARKPTSGDACHASLPRSYGMLLNSISVALTGTDAQWSADHAPPRHGVLRHHAVAAAFESTATVRIVDCAPGLWAVLRVSADGYASVLCVHNATDHAVAFRPVEYLIDGPRGQAAMFFLAGATSTAGNIGDPVCEVAAHDFVWLASFAEPSLAAADIGTNG